MSAGLTREAGGGEAEHGEAACSPEAVIRPNGGKAWSVTRVHRLGPPLDGGGPCNVQVAPRPAFLFSLAVWGVTVGKSLLEDWVPPYWAPRLRGNGCYSRRVQGSSRRASKSNTSERPLPQQEAEKSKMEGAAPRPRRRGKQARRRDAVATDGAHVIPNSKSMERMTGSCPCRRPS